MPPATGLALPATAVARLVPRLDRRRAHWVARGVLRIRTETVSVADQLGLLLAGWLAEVARLPDGPADRLVERVVASLESWSAAAAQDWPEVKVPFRVVVVSFSGFEWSYATWNEQGSWLDLGSDTLVDRLPTLPVTNLGIDLSAEFQHARRRIDTGPAPAAVTA
jgi:hypothetical protein